jgi:hypothetical protein
MARRAALMTCLAAFGAVFYWPAAGAMAQAPQDQCNDRASVVALLAKKYKEAPVAAGVARGGGLVEVLSTGDGETWTIIVTTPQGRSCLIAAGEGWRAREALEGQPL